ncbi:MAG: sigma-54-dependent Fis family transcriptional regulator [Deltaproteobacteria bacterium]|nr:sigma-54-dependent Fis family transcriptional regulator [Deltaproteobacteria bacterium]
MARVLIIDDENVMCSMLASVLEDSGHEADSAYTLKSGLELAYAADYDVVYLDVHMPDGNGLQMLPQIKDSPSEPEVIIMTGMGDPDGAELAIKSGAWDYIEKPSSIHSLMLPLERALQYREKKMHDISLPLKREKIIGSSRDIQQCLSLLNRAAHSFGNVLITGETGTGKELFARAIHDNSSRANRPFIVLDCTSLPETLVESLLFGYEKGAFTGADSAHDGLVGQADGGTLFLDEVAELPLALQKTFLRVLQEHYYRPVGGSSEQESDFRLVAATNRHLEQMVEQGQFRKDLLFRLSSFVIDLPPLRSRREDIMDIVFYQMQLLCERSGLMPKNISPDFREAVYAYDWPGNVRELVNTLERAVTMSAGEPTLFPKHLPTNIRVKIARLSVGRCKLVSQNDMLLTPQSKDFPRLREMRNITEAQYLRDLLAFTDSDIKKACGVSGLSRSRLYALLKRHGLSSPAQSH